MDHIGRQVRVRGRVQGVFYRAWTAQQAGELGISGWIRNLPDGSVEARLTGVEQKIDQLIERMRRGPPDAIINALAVTTTAPEPDSGFRIVG